MKQIGILLLGGILLASCGRQAATAPEVFHVRTTTATPNLTPDNRREYPFISRPYNETTLSFRVSGPLENNRLQAGQHFRAGQTLLAMDDRDFRLEEERTRALEEQTRAEYNRVEALYREGNISGTAREKARADHRVAKAAHDAALNALQDTRLTAPFDGHVQSVLVEPFQEVKASQPVLTFIELDKLKIETYIPGEVAALLQNGSTGEKARVTVRFDKDPAQSITPSEIYLSRNTTSNNLAYLLTAIIPNPRQQWLGGMSGTLTVELPSAEQPAAAWLLPQSAICHDERDGDHVWVARQGKAHLVPVSVGQFTGSQVEVSGITGRDTVILSRQTFLSEGTSVKF